MKFKFIGKYTGWNTSITYGRFTFEGHDPTDVTDPDLIERLSKNPEFAKVPGPAKKTSDQG